MPSEEKRIQDATVFFKGVVRVHEELIAEL